MKNKKQAEKHKVLKYAETHSKNTANLAQQIEVKMKMPVQQPLPCKTLHIQVYVKSCIYRVQNEANLFLANKIDWKP